MSQTDARSMEQIRRDAERARADLTDTVQQLRDSVSGGASDVRQRFSPESIKEDLLGAARRNPLQAAAVGALVAWPAMRIARSIPLPVLMIGAGLFLTGSRTGQDLSRKAVERASDLAGEARRKAHDLTDAASDAAADLSEDVRRRAGDAQQAASELMSDVASRASSTMRAMGAPTGAADSLAESARDTAAAVRDAAGTARDTLDDMRRRSMAASDSMLAWAKANPFLIAGLGMIAGGFVASALPPTDVERNVAGTVSGAVRGAARQGMSAAMGVAAGAAVDMARRAAEKGLNPDGDDVAQDHRERAAKAAEAAADAAMGRPDEGTQQQFKAGE